MTSVPVIIALPGLRTHNSDREAMWAACVCVLAELFLEANRKKIQYVYKLYAYVLHKTQGPMKQDGST